MATRTLEIDLRQGTGASSEPMYGVVTVQRAKAKSAGGFEILPFETTLKLINGKATITEAETDGTGPLYDSAYLFRVQNGYCAPRWGFMAALPDGSTPITTGELPMVDPITGEGIYMDAQEWNALYGDLPNRVTGLEDRVGSLEALGGLSPESPIDGQTANLIEQDGTLTSAAVDERIRVQGRDAINVINFVDFGGVGDGVFDNATLLDQALDQCRATKKTLFIPAGKYFSSGNHDISGCNILGELAGYYNRAGTILVGDGSNVMFEQKQTNLDNITHNIRALNIENVSQGIIVSYSIYSVFEDLFIKSTGTSFTLGTPTIIGPIWNQLNRVKCDSSAGVGLDLGGKDWNNSNKMDTCDFKGALAGVKITTAGGYGAIDNIFINCEIRGAQLGFHFAGTNRSTKIESCYIEPKGPALATEAITLDVQLVGNIYGSTGNDVGLAPRFIDHRALALDIKIIGGWVTTSDNARQANLDFIGSDAPGSLHLDIVSEPRVSAASAGFKLFDTSVISAINKQHRGEFTITKHATPRLTISYPDGSKPFTIRRNGSQNGADYGVYFRNGNNDAMTIDSAGAVNILKRLGVATSEDATSLGAMVKRFPIYNSSGTLLGYVPIHASGA